QIERYLSSPPYGPHPRQDDFSRPYVAPFGGRHNCPQDLGTLALGHFVQHQCRSIATTDRPTIGISAVTLFEGLSPRFPCGFGRVHGHRTLELVSRAASALHLQQGHRALSAHPTAEIRGEEGDTRSGWPRWLDRNGMP